MIKAIVIDAGLRSDKAGYVKAISIALSTHDHSFRFAHQAARNMMTEQRETTGDELADACKLIEQGRSAILIEPKGTIVEGPRFPLRT